MLSRSCCHAPRQGGKSGGIYFSWKVIKYILKQKISVLYNRNETSFFKFFLIITLTNNEWLKLIGDQGYDLDNICQDF